MEIVYRKLSELKPNPKNPRKATEGAIARLAASIKENPKFFEARPILLSDRTGELVIIGGERRSEAAALLKMKTVPTILLSGLTEQEEDEILIKDNTHAGVWDEQKLQSWEKGQLQSWNVDGVKWPKQETKIKEDNFDPKKKVKSRVKRGDIWQLGKHRLMCGDSTKLENVQKLTGGGRIDILFTDPPYNVHFNGRSGKFEIIENDNLSKEEFQFFIDAVCDVIKKLNIRQLYIWCNWKFYGLLQEKFEYNACIVWAKNIFGFGRGYRHQHEFCLFSGTIDPDITTETDLWQEQKDATCLHPTQKPIGLAARALRNHRDGETVLDLFGGSGSTLMAAEQLNKMAFVMEIDPHYCDVIINRWEEFTGQKAKKIE